MTPFFIIAGIVVTVIGLADIAIISSVFIAVKYFGLILTFGINKERKNDE